MESSIRNRTLMRVTVYVATASIPGSRPAT